MPETKPRLKPQPLYIVSSERRFVYFVVQKVACSSIKTALLPLFDVDVSPHEKTLQDGSRIVKIHELFDGSDHQVRRARFVRRLDEGEYRDYFKFAFVRNPWDRLVSLYFQKVAGTEGTYIGPDLNPPGVNGRFYRGMPFAEYVEAVCATPDEAANPHFRSQHLVVCPRNDGEVLADFVGRFENLAPDFSHVAERIGAPDLELPHRLRSRDREKQPYSDFYDARLRDLAGERFRQDIETFGYSF